MLSLQEEAPYSRMANLRPVPSAFVAFGSTRELTEVIGEARRRRLIRRKERWHFVIEDFDAPNFVVKEDIDAGPHNISLSGFMIQPVRLITRF